MKKLLLITCLLTTSLLSGGLLAQAPFFQTSRSEATVIKYNQGPQPDITNHMIQKLSQGNQSQLNRTRILLAHDEVLTLSRVSQYEIRVSATIDNFQVEGDTRYRGFDVSQYLQPSAFTYRLIRRDGLNKVKNDWKFDEVALNGNSSQVANFVQRDSTNYRLDKLEMLDKGFIYKKSTRDLFDSQILRIDEYFQAAQELEGIYQQLLTIRPDDIDGIFDQERALQAIEGRIESIRQLRYEELLQLGPQQDPAQFVPRFADAQGIAVQLRQQIQATQAQLPVLYHERGMAALGAGDRNQALRDFNRSTEIAPDFAPPHLQIALISYRDGNTQVAVDRLLNMLRTMNPDPDTRAQAMPVLQESQGAILASIREAIRLGDYGPALNLIALNRGVCDEFPELNCAADFIAEEKNAHMSSYSEKIRTGGAQFTAGEFEAAEQTFQSAIDYQRSVPSFIPNAMEAEAFLGKSQRGRYQQMLAGARNVLDRGLFDRAEALVNEALAYQAGHPQSIPSDQDARTLQGRLYQEQYQSLATRGQQALANNRHQSALELLEQARNLEAAHGMPRDTALENQARQAARMVALGQMQDALRMAGENRLPAARDLASDAQTLSARYDLQGDPELGALQDRLSDAIFSQECVNAQAEYDRLVQIAQRSQRAGRYVDAQGQYEAALVYAGENAACGIDRNAVTAALAEIKAPAAYQQTRSNIDVMVDRALHQDAVTAYLAAGRDFERGYLDRFGFSHPDLIDFIQNSGRSAFVHYGAEYFMDQKDYPSSLQLLRHLARIGYPKGNMKGTQTRLGVELAIRDFARNPNANYKALGMEYTQGNSSLKFIYKAFKKQWKRMD